VTGPAHALSAVRHAADLVAYRVRRDAHEREDRATLSELEGESADLRLAPGVGLEWLGVAGYRITYEDQTLLLDPYFTRVPFRNVLRRVPALPDPALLERHVPAGEQVAAIAIGHTHFDHAVDAPAIARAQGCPVYGSASLGALMRLHGLGDQAVEVTPYRVYEAGPFELTFVPSAHSKLLLGLRVPYDGELTCAHLDGLAPSAYRCGQVWGIHIAVGGMTFYHQGSADLVDDAVRHREVDVFLAGVAGRSFTPRYWERVLPKLDPGVVVPSHYDDFFRPLDAPMGFAANVRVAAVPGEVAAVSRDAAVVALPLAARR
jgi:L-ascorbate metabolism protein UlaG (beta-lactamase superfamily)